MPSAESWILTDDDASLRTQLLAVGGQLAAPWRELPLRYTILSDIAGFTAGIWHLDATSRSRITTPWPEWILCAGRKAAAVALFVQNASPSTRLAHLSWPVTQPARFAVIAVPEGEKIDCGKSTPLRIPGAPIALTQKTLHFEAARWQAHTARLPRPFVLLAVGGATRALPYEDADFKTLAAHASAEAERLGGSLLVTCRAETGTAHERQVKSLLTAPHLFHSWRAGEDNPYLGFLGLADAAIITGDSNTLCLEAAFTHKPLYIFLPPHGRRDGSTLPERLFQSGAAKPHTYPVRLDWQPTIRSDGASLIAQAMSVHA